MAELLADMSTLFLCRDLEMAVENLSELLETPFEAEDIAALRAKTTDKSVYVQKRHHIMMQDT